MSIPLQTACLWALRCLAVQRQLLDEKNEIMKNRIFDLMEKGNNVFHCRFCELIPVLQTYT